MAQYINRSLILLVIFCLFSIMTVAAQDSGPDLRPPSVRLITDTLNSLEKNEEISTSAKDNLTELYEQTLEYLDLNKSNEKKLKELEQEQVNTPTDLRRVQQALEQTKIVSADSIEQRYRSSSLPTLEKALFKDQDQQRVLQQQQSRLNNRITVEQGRPDTAQDRINTIIAEQQDINSELADLLSSGEQNTLQKARTDLLLAMQQAFRSERVLLRQEILANGPRLDLLLTRRELNKQQQQNLSTRISVLQSLVYLQRRVASEKTIAEIAGLDNIDSPILREEVKKNSELGQKLLSLNNQQVNLQQEDNRIRELQGSLQELAQSISQQSVALENSPALGKLLRQQQSALNKLNINLYPNIDQEIADIRLQQFNYNSKRQRLADIPRLMETLLKDNSLKPLQQNLLKQRLTSQLQTQRKLLDKIQQELSNTLSIAIDLKLNQSQLQQQTQRLTDQLDEQLFWIATNTPMSLKWLKKLPEKISQELQTIEPSAIAKAWIEGAQARTTVTLIAIALVITLLMRRSSLRTHLTDLSDRVGNVRRDNIWLTPRALLLEALIILPAVLLVLLTGYLLRHSSDPLMDNLGKMVMITAMFLFFISYASALAAPQGIIEVHFRRPADHNIKLRRVLYWSGVVMLPMIITIPVFGLDAVISQILTIFGCLMLSLLLYRLRQQVGPVFNSNIINAILWNILILAPLGLVILLVQGYLLTVVNLLAHLMLSLIFICGWALLRATIRRGIYVASRRLAYTRAANRLAALREDKEVEIPNLDLATVNRQTLRLTNALMLGLLAMLMYWLWQDMVSVFSRLNTVTLFNLGATESGIHLSDTLIAILTLIITFLLTRNLPGMLEMSVLSKLELRQGISYAITSLLSYTITAIGIIMALSTLGVSWNKLQWLVAALGVGLGFGLQEVFANFISGIILLFERPIRIGDTVTIGEWHGTVSRIRIRATTVTDWDNKEIVIPNKMFITERLINWTLSDQITRVIIKVGIAYGSDLHKTRELLLKIAREYPLVLQDPAPDVFFLRFGDSTLDHELRFYVREMGDRLKTINDINITIDTQFRESGIEVAFPQQDIHVRSWQVETRRHYHYDETGSTPTSVAMPDKQKMRGKRKGDDAFVDDDTD